MASKLKQAAFSALIVLGILFSLALPVSAVQAQTARPPIALAKTDLPEPTNGIGLDVVRDVYTFQALADTYTEITGGTLHGSGTGVDDNNYNNIAIGFPFYFNSIAYTSLSINANGFVRFGTTSFSGTCAYAPISSTDTTCVNLVAAQGEDLQGNTGGTLRSELLGTAPNRIFVIQWKDFRHYGATAESYNFQIQLHENGNLVKFVYGPYTKNSTIRSVQVGLKGANATDYENRTTSLPTNTWANPLRGMANNATMTLATSSFPASGQTYVWTPPPPSANFMTSAKIAPAEAVLGSPFTYTIQITNSGTLATTATHLSDPIPAGLDYVDASLTCSSGTCSYDSVQKEIIWDGPVAIGETITVSFQVVSNGLPCNSVVQNNAVLTDPIAFPVTVTKSASTRLVSVLPSMVQSFDGTTFPPTGWTQTPLVGANLWDRVTSGSNPSIAPHSGAGMARWNSYSITNGNATRLQTPTLDLPINAPRKLVFYMSHDTGYPSNDRIEMQISTDDGATWTDMGITFSRYDATYTTPGWGKHEIDLSAYAGQTQVKLGFKAVSAYGNNFFVDDVALIDATYPCPCTITSSVKAGCQTDTVQHELVVTCVTNETVNLSLGSSTWPASISPATVTVPAGGSASATVSVQVPYAAQRFAGSAVSVSAVPQSIPVAFVQANVQTNYTGVGNAWQVMAPLPAARVFAAEAATDSYVFVIGGTSDAAGNTSVDTVYRYSIADNVWETMAPMPVAVDFADAAVINGKIYIPGYITTTSVADTLVYDIAANSWSTLPGNGTFVGAAGYVVVADEQNGILYRLGGLVDDGSGNLVATNKVWALDVANGTWSELPPMTTARTGFAAMFYGGSLYVTGGMAFPGFAPIATTEIFDGTTWTTGAPVPTGAGADRWGIAGDAAAFGALYLFGGQRDNAWTLLNHTGSYDAAQNAWGVTPLLPTLNTGRVYLGGAKGANYLWATGGRNSAGTTAYAVHERLALCTPAHAAVDVQPATASKLGLAGANVTYTLTLRNTGTVTDTFTLSNTSVWTVQVSPAGPYTLAPGATQSLTVTVSIPSGANIGDFDVATLTFTSGLDALVSDSAQLTTTVTVNSAPVATDDAWTVNEDAVLTIAAPGVLTNDTDVDGDALTAELVTGPAVGTLTLNADGSFTYTPPADYFGTVTFTYRAYDGVSYSAPATVTITVAPINDAPVAVADSYGMNEDATLTIAAPGVLTNDSDADGDALTADLVTGPTVGTLTLNADGSFTYTSPADYFGTVTFTYRTYDGVAYSAPATVTITVASVNDAPVAVADSYSMNEDATLTIAAPGVLANDTDVDGDALTAELVTGPTVGTLTLNANGSFTYTPSANYFGTVTFTYRAYDGVAYSAPATVTITVAPINDAPVAGADSYTMDEDTTLTIAAPGVLANDTDAEGNALTAELVTGPTTGTLVLNANGSFTYTPPADYFGTVTFTYRAYDGVAYSAPATVTITVAPINDAPVAVDDSYAMDEDTTLTIPAPGVLANDTDADDDALAAELVTGPTVGTLTLNADGSFTYTPPADYFGTVTFTYRADDGLAYSAPATVTITIADVSDLRYLYLPMILK